MVAYVFVFSDSILKILLSSIEDIFSDSIFVKLVKRGFYAVVGSFLSMTISICGI